MELQTKSSDGSSGDSSDDMGSGCSAQSSGPSRQDPAEDNVSPGWRRCKTVLPMCFLGMCFLLGTWKGHDLKIMFKNLLAQCQHLGLWAALILFACSAVLNIFMFPTFPLMVGAGVQFTKMYGAMLGSIVGVASVFSGLWLGSVVAFQLGRTIWKDFAMGEHEGSQAFRIVNAMIEEEGVKIVLLARMSPLLPAEIFNYVCSLTKLTLWQYAVGCFGSLVPVTFWVITAARATEAAQSTNKKTRAGDLLLIVVNALILMLLTGLLYNSYRRYRRKMGYTAMVAPNESAEASASLLPDAEAQQ